MTTLKNSIVQLTKRCPEKWATLEIDSLSNTESKALSHLTESGVIERRVKFRFKMLNDPLVMDAVLLATGEYGLVEAATPIVNKLWQSWEKPFQEWLDSETKNDCPFHCEYLKPGEWRIAEGAEAAKQELRDDQADFLNFVLKKNKYYNRSPIRGYGRLESFEEVEAKSDNALLERMDQLESSLQNFILEQFENMAKPGANSASSQKIKLPENQDVIELCKLLNKKPAGISYNEVARRFVGDTGANWEALMAQARKFKHLWPHDDK